MELISSKYPTLIKGSLGEKTVDLIRYYLPEKSSILEFGCGVTSKLLLNWYNVYSIEHNHRWLNHSNAYHVPLKMYDGYGFIKPEITGLPFAQDQIAWYDPSVLKDVLDKIPNYDFIIVDGPNGNLGRGGFYTYLHLFNTSVPILFHDVDRQCDFELMKKVSNKLNRECFILEEDVKTGFIK